jgi:hypothetical protein
MEPEMAGLRYTYQNDNNIRSLTVVVDGNPVTVDDTHVNFAAALNACRAGNVDAARKALNVDGAISDALASVGAGFTYADGVVRYDNEPVSDGLNKAILGVLAQKGDVSAFANFAARLNNNPGYRSRNSLFSWIEKHGLIIDNDGYLIAYKGVKPNDAGDYVSINHGYGVVNGDVTENGALRNNVGDVVEVPRHKVDDNPQSHCSFGLHAGTHEYASAFAQGVLLTVRIDPADVVSVPNDGHKIRACKYVVIATTEKAWTASVVWDGESDEVESADYGDDTDEDYWNPDF